MKKVTKKFLGYMPIILILLTWELCAAYNVSPFFPAFSSTCKAILNSLTKETLLWEVGISVFHSIAALCIAILISVPLGILIGRSSFIHQLLDPLINFLRLIPSAAIIPIAMIFLGIEYEMKMFVIVFGSSWPILINAIDGVRGIEPMLLRTSNILGFSNYKKLKHIIVPASLPAIFTGIRISLAISFILTISIEMIIGTSGIGYYIIDKERSFKFPEMYGGILILGLIGITINRFFNLIESHTIKWYYEHRKI